MERVAVDLQVDMVHCGTVQAVSLSRLVTLLSFSQVKHSIELMVIFLLIEDRLSTETRQTKTTKHMEKQY